MKHARMSTRDAARERRKSHPVGSAVRDLLDYATARAVPFARLAPIVRRAQAGDAAAVETLMLSSVSLAAKFAGRVRPGGSLGTEDLVSAALVALVRALPKFDARKATWSTFATYVIRGAIQRAAAAGRGVRMPEYLRMAIAAGHATLRSPLAVGPVAPRIAERARAVYAGRHVISDRAPIAPCKRPGPRAVAEAREEVTRGRGIIAEALRACDGRGRAFLTLRYGLGGARPMSVAEVAARYHTTPLAVRRVEAALMRIRSVEARA